MLTFKQKLRLAWRILRERPSNLQRHAARELSIALPGNDKWDIALREDLEEIVLVFAAQGHSGGSAASVTEAARKLLRFEPLTPLTGDDSEWVYLGDGLFQNNRCSRVFKSDTEGAYDIDGIVFREPSGACFTSRDSFVLVKFPYTPTTEVRDVAALEDA